MTKILLQSQLKKWIIYVKNVKKIATKSLKYIYKNEKFYFVYILGFIQWKSPT